MAAETVKPRQSSLDSQKHRHLDHELKEMISGLITRLSDLHHVHKPGASHHQQGEEDEHGVGIITLAGTNTGATMRGQLSGHHHKNDDDQDEFLGDEHESQDTYVNSNFQAVNNSIMLGASYTANDPGVHMEIADVVDTRGHKHDKHGKKGSKKGKGVAHGNPHSDTSE